VIADSVARQAEALGYCGVVEIFADKFQYLSLARA